MEDNEGREDNERRETIDAEEARVRMGTDATVLDIRSDEEWQSVGNIPGAVSADGEDATEAVKQIDEESTVIVVCEDGERSREVANELREAGRDAVSLEGGMAGWAGNDLPMQPTQDPALASDPGSVEDEVADEGETSGEGETSDRDDRSEAAETSGEDEGDGPPPG